MRFLMTVAYDGSKYKGYQKQPNQNTIQGCVEEVLTKINKEPVFVSASGRTDAGVHALGQRVHFDLKVNMRTDQIQKAVNSLLPSDIYVKKIEKVSSNFHARFDVKEKVYVYKLNMGEYNPIEKDYVLQVNHFLDVEKMKEASRYLIGEHNFRAFTKVDEEKESYVRTIHEITFHEKNHLLCITFKGNGFLRYMVRNLVGTLIEVGEGKRSVSEIPVILESQDRKKAGKTAPACGLYLRDVFYS